MRYICMEPLRNINFRFVLTAQGASMRRSRVHEAAYIAAIASSFIFLFAVVALAQERPLQDRPGQDGFGRDDFMQDETGQERHRGTPGQFDFYVLSLSWSPSYCEATQTRARGRA